MKLKNRKTGEVGKLRCDMQVTPAKIGVFEDTKDGLRGHYWEYHSLAELCEEWEDAPEEPKLQVAYYIDRDGDIVPYKIGIYPERIFNQEQAKSIGNYFSSREEAELAVKKLQAWKRLKDKGFRADQWGVYADGCLSVRIRFNKHSSISEDDKKDLDLLFSGGEE